MKGLLLHNHRMKLIALGANCGTPHQHQSRITVQLLLLYYYLYHIKRKNDAHKGQKLKL